MTLFTPALKPLLQAPGALLAPGIYDSFSALIAQQAGFKAAYLSGASIAYTRLGRSDVGLTTYTEVEQTLSRIADRVPLPNIGEGASGFGNSLTVMPPVRSEKHGVGKT